MQANNPKGSIVVTGATGWMGLTVIQELYRILPRSEARARIHPFASQQSSIRVDPETLITAEPLRNLSLLAKEGSIAIIIHCAFLTPDKLSAMGVEQFISVNQAITREICYALELNPKARVVSMSSGAAGDAPERLNTTEASAKEVYGWLKLDEEHRLRELAATLVLRIFALTGRNMRNPRQYALGDFIYQALIDKQIIVNCTRKTVRGYGPAGEIARLAVLWAMSQEPAPKQPISTVSHIIELTELAKMVALRISVGRPVNSLEADLPVDTYIADPGDFLMILKRFRIICPSLERQIDKTRLAFLP